MNRNFSLFLIFTLLFSFANAQEFSVKGRVLDSKDQPLIFANVLLQSTDTVLLAGTATNEEGFFELNNIEKGTYLLSASYLDNFSEIKKISVTSDIDVDRLIIEQTEEVLDEVVVSYKKPTIEQKADRLVFNIENTSLSDSDIWSVVKRTPGVIVVNDKISIKGSTNIGVMINGKKVNIPQEDISNLLSGSSASNVEAVEVVLNPPAKYSAEGGMLLDIKMKKNLIAGYNGSVYNRYTQGVFAKHMLGTDHFFKGEKTDFSITYSFRADKRLNRYTDITNFFENNVIDEIWTAEQSTVSKGKHHNINAFFDYRINARNNLSISTINSFSTPANRYITSQTLISDPNGDLNSSFSTDNNSDYEVYNTSYYLDWTHKLKREGAEISFSNHFTYYDYDRGQEINTDFFDLDGTVTGANDFTTNSGQKTALYTFQLDYATPIKKSSKLETGLRYAGINSESKVLQEGFDRNQPGIDPTEEGLFSYDESIMAAYVSLNNNWKKWQLNVGLRSEYTETKGNLETNLAPIKNSYLEFFPSISVQHELSEKNDLNLKYYRRITRPRYDDLNPFQYFQSNNAVVEGNPYLKPTTRNYISLGYTYDKSYTVELFYLAKKDDFFEQVVQDNDSNLLRFVSTNLESNQSYGIDFRINKRWTNFWDIYVLLSYFYKENGFIDLDSGNLLENNIMTAYFVANNYFTLLKDKSLFADITFRYLAPTVYGNSERESTSELGLSFRKTIWNKKASISLGVEDIFNDGNIFSTRNYLNQNNSTFSRSEKRLFVFGFRYKFGNTKIRDNQKRKSTEEDSRI